MKEFLEVKTNFEIEEEGFIDEEIYHYLGISEEKFYQLARKNNAGWRIDYFIVSDRIKDKIKDAQILNDIYGSDHCPVLLEIEL